MGLYVDITKQLGRFSLRVKFFTEENSEGFLGVPDCGKKILFDCIAGVTQPDDGQIILDGRVLFDAEKGIAVSPQKRHIGYLLSGGALFPNMTVRQNILCGMRLQSNRAARLKQLETMYDIFPLRDIEKLYPAQLSSAQKQETALARILVTKPRFLLLDEPFSMLDTSQRDAVQFRWQTIAEHLKLPTLWSACRLADIYGVCRQLYILDKGHIKRTGAPQNIFEEPDNIAAARLTDCQNIAAARRIGNYELEVPSWGVRLTAARPIPNTLHAVGIRADRFQTNQFENFLPVVCTTVIEEPLTQRILFRFPNQAAEAPALWWRVPKQQRPRQFPKALGVARQDVLLLCRPRR